MGARIAAHDWSTSPLGDPAAWPQSLKTAIGLMLPAQAQIVLFWGGEYVAFYNDAYAPTIGDKHPRALGRPAAENWAELWSDLHPLLRSVRETGKTVHADDRPFYIERHGGVGEEVFFDISYSAVPDDAGAVGGVLCIVSETTERVRAARRREFLLTLADSTRALADPDAIVGLTARMLGEHLDAQRVIYAEIHEPTGTVKFHDGWFAQGVDAPPPQLRLSDFAGIADWLSGGRPIVADDVETHAATRRSLEGLAALDVRALVSVPLIKQGRHVTNLNVHRTHAHHWSADEVSLITEVAERTWESVERARIKAAQDASQRELQLLADTLPVLVSYVDANRRYRFVNHTYEEWFPDRKQAHVVGATVAEVVGDAAYALVEPYIDRVLAGNPVSFEQLLPFAGGPHRHVHVDYMPRIEAGHAVGFYVLVNDISEAKRAEAALRESEERFRNMADHAPVMMWVTDPSGYCTYLNQAWYDFTGQTRQEAEGYGWLDATHPDHKAEAERVFLEANAAQGSFRVEYRLRRADGHYRWAIDAAAPRFDTDGAYLGYIGSVIDIDERREAELALQVNEERLRLATDAADIGFWDVDLIHDQLIWPTRLLRMFGILTDRPVSMTDFYNGLHPDDYDSTYAAFARAADPAIRALYDVEYRTVGADDGVVRWIAAKGRGLFDEAGRCLRVVGTAIDITQRKAAEIALRESERRLRFLGKLDEALRTVRDPVAAMEAATRLLGERLVVARCAYADVDADSNRFTIRADYCAPGVPTSAGQYSLDLFGSRAAAELRAGDTLVVRDVPTELAAGEGREMFQAIGIDAIICCPLIKDGGLRSMMAVHNASARDWQPEEVALVETVVERCWAQIERIAAEARLRESETRYRTLFTSIESGFCVVEVDLDGAKGRVDYRVIEANPAFYRQTGFDEAVQGRWLRDEAPDLEEFWFDTYGRIARTGEAERFEQGSAALGRWFDVYAFRVGAADEQRVAILFNDISARKRDEELREAQNRVLALALGEGDLAATLKELMLRVEALSEAGMLGSILLVEGDHLRLGAAPSLPEAYNSAIDGIALGANVGSCGTAAFLNESVFARDIDTDPRWTAFRELALSHDLRSCWSTPIRSADGGVLGTFAIYYHEPREPAAGDLELVGFVTQSAALAIERHRSEAALRELNETLEARVIERTQELETAHEALRQSQKMEAMGQLTGGVAHDFNNLLTPIVGALDLLERKGLGGDREQRLIAGAAQSADRAATLVQRLLAFARRQPLKMVPVDLGGLVDGMADLIASTTGPQINVVAEVAAGLPRAMADPNQLEMALLNLAVNARDAMPDGGTLRISATEEADPPAGLGLQAGPWLRLSVADTGIGMNAETLKRAIEPFFSTKGIGRGTGLGLSMVHGLASQLGGALHITSAPGLGTHIELWLPQTSDAAIVAGPAAESDLGAGRGAVLLVDDEDLVRATTADMLQDLGFDVTEASSSEEALRLIEGGAAIDLLVTDFLMPGMSGAELAARVRALRGDVPVLVVSGYAEDDGAPTPYPRLTKPFRKTELAAGLADAMGGEFAQA